MKRKGQPCSCVQCPLGIGYRAAVDLAQGVPVCLLCGGLGLTYNDDCFKALVLRITVAHSIYSNSDAPACIRLGGLINLRANIKSLYNRFGDKSLICYARLVCKKDELASEFQRLSLLRRFNLLKLNAQKKHLETLVEGNMRPVDLDIAEAQILTENGRLDEAEDAYQEIIESVPDYSNTYFLYAVFCMVVRRSTEKALKLHLAAGEKFGEARFLYNAAICFQILDRSDLSREYMETARGCKDAEPYLEAIDAYLTQNPPDIDLTVEEGQMARHKIF